MSSSRLIVLSAGMRRMEALPTLLDEFELVFGKPSHPLPTDTVLAWGQRPSAGHARRYAALHGLAMLHIEDGFLRSVGLGQHDPALSIIVDDIGLYLDSNGPSRLEALIRQPLDGLQLTRARALAAAWRESRVSKYNHARDAESRLPSNYVLVVDQTHGDASISAGGATVRSFQAMLEAALAEYPDSTVLVKVHPDVVSGRKKGHFDIGELRARARVQVLERDMHIASLLPQARAVYVVTSQVGFEALLWGRPVRVFGKPFYAGWGLTHDEHDDFSRRAAVPFEQLVHGALIGYSRYVDPETGVRCEVERVLDWLALQRRMRQRFDSHVTAVGFSAWKKPFVRDFFAGSTVRFVRNVRGVRPGGSVAVWGRKHDEALSRLRQGARQPGTVIRLEDGFIRSVGLGADLIRPLSWVQDDCGIYYDATSESRLERLLRDAHFHDALITRAAALRRAILASGITKYNLKGRAAWTRPAAAGRVILVPGQVESDASIQFGASRIRQNLSLLKLVRELNPDAYVLYKRHPDVQAGLRSPGAGEAAAIDWCDEVIDDASFHDLLGAVDEVHVLTSLAGFEALLREVPVTTYGQPFYAGWGLTRDLGLADEVRARRSRRLSLDELVAATLILYPSYVSRKTHRFTTPEGALRELQEWRSEPGAPTGAWRRLVAKLFRKR